MLWLHTPGILEELVLDGPAAEILNDALSQIIKMTFNVLPLSTVWYCSDIIF